MSNEYIEYILVAKEVSSRPITDGRKILACKELGEAPHPKDIRDNFSSCLGDTFHYLHRTIVSVHHIAMKNA